MRHRKSILFVLFIAFNLSAIGQQDSPDYKVLFEKAKFTMETKGDLNGAITLFNDIIKKYPNQREYAANSQLYIGLCYEKLGAKEAQKAYEIVLANYADQPEPAKVARARLNVITGAAGTTKANTEVAMRRVWEAGPNYLASVSPDGNLVVIQSIDDGDLWIRNLKSGDQRRVTREASQLNGNYPGGAAVVSPDGKWIAYDWWYWNNESLLVSALDGSSKKELFKVNGEHKIEMYPIAWMPDNHKLLTVSHNTDDKTYRRHIISLPEGSILDIGQPEKEFIEWGRPSPDGQYILYNLKSDIFIYDTTTGKDTVLIHNLAKNRSYGWTSNGSGILFTNDVSGVADLYSIGFKNGWKSGDPVILKRNIGYRLYPTRDNRIFSIVDLGKTTGLIASLDEPTGKVTGTPTIVDTNYPEVYYPTWSHDGKVLFYVLYKGYGISPVLILHSEETDQTREIIPKSKFTEFYRPIISPDGKSFSVVAVDENMNFGIFLIDSESGEVSMLMKFPKRNIGVDPCPNWSPDSKAIYYMVRCPVKTEGYIIMRKDLLTGNEKEVYRGFPHTRQMQISADGTKFAYFSNDIENKSFTLGILDIQSGKNQVLSRFPEAETAGIGDPSWTKDGTHVMVARYLKKGCELWRFPVAGGAGEKLYYTPDYSWGFSMHPNGRRIAFGQNRHNYELSVMENFLPK